MVLVVSHVSGSRRTWCINKEDATTDDVIEVLREKEGPVSDFVLQCRGHILTQASHISHDDIVVATLRLPGGKGGFGSMLRAIGAQIEKTTNREACRDLSGRRLRDINEEKRLKDFISKKGEREREIIEKKKKKFEKLRETPKHVFQDESYYKQREIREKNLFESLDKAFSNGKEGGSTSGVKRNHDVEAKPVAKLKKGRFMDDLDESSDESESDEESTDATEGKGSSSSEEDTIKMNNEKSSSSNGMQKKISLTSDGEEELANSDLEKSSSTDNFKTPSNNEDKKD